MADSEWVTIPQSEWTTIETQPIQDEWETVEPSIFNQVYGGFMRGWMRIGEGTLAAPGVVVRQVKQLRSAGIAKEILSQPDPESRKFYIQQLKNTEIAYDKFADKLSQSAKFHKKGQKAILRNHPEWYSEPPKSFIDLVSNPSKVAVALAESVPVLLNAGIWTAAGMPQVGVGMMYVSEGQQAYDQAIQDGRTPDEAATAYAIYGTVSACLEQMQLEGVINIAKGSWNRILNRTAQKVSKKGLSALTKDIIKVSATEALEEMSQGTWQEATAKILYDKSIPGGLTGFIDRRAQEGLIAAMLGVVPGTTGATVAKATNLYNNIQSRIASEKPTMAVEAKTPTEPTVTVPKTAFELPTTQVWQQLNQQYTKNELINAYNEWKKTPEATQIIANIPSDSPQAEAARAEGFARLLLDKKPSAVKAMETIKPTEITQQIINIEQQVSNKFGPKILETIRKDSTEKQLSPENYIIELQDNLKLEKPTIIEKPKKITRKQQLKQGHQIPKLFEWDEQQRRDFMEQTTGKRSMKDMSIDERQTYINALQQLATEKGIDIPETKIKLGQPIVVNGKPTTMEKVIDDAVTTIDKLPEKIKIPEHIHRRFFRKIRRTGLAKRLGRLFFGIDNSPLYELANILEQGQSGILTEVFDSNIQQGRAIEAGHKRTVSTLFQNFCKENKITPEDLANISNSCNPRMFQGILESVGRGTETKTIEINKRKYDVSLAELLDIYLIARQEDGLRHISKGGLVISDVQTGAISEQELRNIQQSVESNPKLMQLANLITQVESQIWKSSINNTSMQLDGKEIAKVENWWGLDVLMPRQLAGKQQTFNVNLIENKSILKDRTKADNPIIIRDALQRFTAFENAIAEYVGMANPTRTARTLINNKDFSELLRKKGYEPLRNNMRLILERAQSSPPTLGAFDRLLNWALPGVYRGVLFFNPRVVMSQFTSVTNYGAFISNKYIELLGKGLSPEAIQETLNMSDIAWDRFYMGHSSLELGELAASDATLRLLTRTSSDKNKLGITLRVSDIAALASGMQVAKAEYADAQKGTITGQSSIYWAGKNTSFKEGTTAWKQTVTKRAEYLWHKSQPSWDKWSRSAITSDPSAIRRLFFLFRSFHEKSLTILHSADTEYNNSAKTFDDKLRFAKKWGAVLSGYTLNTILRSLIMVGLTRKIKEPFDYIKDIVTAPFRMLPLLGHILDGAIRSFANSFLGKRAEYRGQALESLPIEVINQIIHAPVNFTQAAGYALDGENEKARRSLRNAVGQLYTGLGLIMGLPVYELKRLFKGWIQEEPKKKAKGGRRWLKSE